MSNTQFKPIELRRLVTLLQNRRNVPVYELLLEGDQHGTELLNRIAFTRRSRASEEGLSTPCLLHAIAFYTAWEKSFEMWKKFLVDIEYTDEETLEDPKHLDIVQRLYDSVFEANENAGRELFDWYEDIRDEDSAIYKPYVECLPDVSLQYLNECYKCPEAGQEVMLYWQLDRPRSHFLSDDEEQRFNASKKRNNKANYVGPNKHMTTKLNNTVYPAHYIIYALYHQDISWAGKKKVVFVDGDELNVTPENLALVDIPVDDS